MAEDVALLLLLLVGGGLLEGAGGLLLLWSLSVGCELLLLSMSCARFLSACLKAEEGSVSLSIR